MGCGVQAFGPLSGINVIHYTGIFLTRNSRCGPRIYEILGISNQTSLMIIGISRAPSIIIGLYLLDRIGRIPRCSSTQFKPQALTAVGFKYFYFFALNLVAMTYYYLFYPETATA
ncbi:hypothetical protein VTO42DRAFT_3607 [Malbranchea cinnamomea]